MNMTKLRVVNKKKRIYLEMHTNTKLYQKLKKWTTPSLLKLKKRSPLCTDNIFDFITWLFKFSTRHDNNS